MDILDPELIEKVRVRVVEKGMQVPEILVDIPGLSRFDLGRIIAQSNMREAREQYLRTKVFTEPGNSLTGHKVLTSDLLSEIRRIAEKLKSETLTPVEIKVLSAKAEALRRLAEAAHLVTRLDRDVHGVRPGVPSEGKPLERQEVEYYVRVNDMNKPDQQASGS